MFATVKHLARSLPAAAAALAFVAGVTMAPDDVSAQARKTTVNCTIGQDGNVLAEFDIRGVGNQNLCVVASSEVTAQCICRNEGGNCPQAANKREETIVVTDSATFEPRNGRIQGSLSLDAPTDADCAQTLSCPGNQEPILAAFSADPIVVNVYEDFVPTEEGCEPTGDAIRTGECRQGVNQVNDRQCARAFR